MKTFKSLIIAFVSLCTLVMADAASAHRFWMLPSTFTLSGEEAWITVDGAISNDLFFANYEPLSIAATTVTGPKGKQLKIENPVTLKFRSAFDVRLTEQGTYRITENGGAFFATWMENGEEISRRAPLEDFIEDGITDIEDVQLLYSSRRVEAYVTLGAPTSDAFNPTGVGIELLPVTHPNDIYAGEEAEFRLLMNGAPAVNLSVELIKGHDRYRDLLNTVTLETDLNGIIKLPINEPGRYWLAAQGESTTEIRGIPMSLLSNYSLTFEVLPQ